MVYGSLMPNQNEAKALAERWRVAGLILRRIDPVAFEAWLAAAEVIAAETPEVPQLINFPDYIS